MRPATVEWVRKAEGDYDVVCVLLRSRKKSRFDAICFHAQQCVEKYLKGRLIEAHLTFPKTHELSVLLRLIAPVEPLWTIYEGEMRALSKWGITPRYPGVDADGEAARESVRICRKIRNTVRLSLGLKI